MKRFIRIAFILLITIGTTSVMAQDLIIRTNGAQINAKVVEVTADSVYYKNKKMAGNPVFSMPASEVKLIEYWNGKKEYLEGSYANNSKTDTATEITGVKALDSKVFVAGIAMHIERLFTEYHLIMDYTYHPDSNFIASKGKIEFEFERSKINFFVKYYPTGEKTTFAKFLFNETGENKKYAKLANETLTSMVIYYEDSVSTIQLETQESERLNEMFSGKDIRYKP